jgi:hypothetical protein
VSVVSVIVFEAASESVYSPEVTSQVKVDVVPRARSLADVKVSVESCSPPDSAPWTTV